MEDARVPKLQTLCMQVVKKHCSTPENYNDFLKKTMYLPEAVESALNQCFDEDYRNILKPIEHKTITESTITITNPIKKPMHKLFNVGSFYPNIIKSSVLKSNALHRNDFYLNHDGSKFFTVQDGVGMQVDTQSGIVLYILDTPYISAYTANDNYICTVDKDPRTFKLWDIETGKLVKSSQIRSNIDIAEEDDYDISINNDKNTIDIADGSGKMITMLRPYMYINSISLSNDGKLCAVNITRSPGGLVLIRPSSYSYSKIIDLSTQTILKTFGSTQCTALKDGKHIITHKGTTLTLRTKDNLHEALWKRTITKNAWPEYLLSQDHTFLLSKIDTGFEVTDLIDNKSSELTMPPAKLNNTNFNTATFDSFNGVLGIFCTGEHLSAVCDLLKKRTLIKQGNPQPLVNSAQNHSKIKVSGDGKTIISLQGQEFKKHALNDLLYLWRTVSWEQKLAIMALSNNKNQPLQGAIKKIFDSFATSVQTFLRENFAIPITD